MLHRPLIQRAGGFTPPIEQSLICDGAAYLSWTPGAASTSRRVGSLALWVRRIDFGANDRIFSSRLDSSNFLIVEFQTDNTMRVWFRIGGADYIWVTSAVFRDPGWWHLMMSWNTTTQTFLLLRNGVPLTFSSSATLPLNGDTSIYHNGARQTLSAWFDGSGHSEIFSGAIADPHMLDGTALADALDFVDGFAFDGQAIPAPVLPTGLTYGTNGAHLSFADTAAFGDDTSGNGNDWTPTGFVSTDQTADVPGRPYAVLSGLIGGTSATIGDGGLSMSAGTTAAHRTAGASFTLPVTGKWYWEVTACSSVNSEIIGVASIQNSPQLPASGGELGRGTRGDYGYSSTGNKYNNNAFPGVAYGATYTSGDVIGVAWDSDAGEIEFFKNGVSQGVAYTGVAQVEGKFVPAASSAETGADVFNFGQRAFTYTPPTGFLPLSKDNFETPSAAADPDTGTFTANGNANGPVVWLGYAPSASDTLTIGGSPVTWGTHADRLNSGFKLRTASSPFNDGSGSKSFSLVTANAIYGGGDAPWPLAQ